MLGSMLSAPQPRSPRASLAPVLSVAPLTSGPVSTCSFADAQRMAKSLLQQQQQLEQQGGSPRAAAARQSIAVARNMALQALRERARLSMQQQQPAAQPPPPQQQRQPLEVCEELPDVPNSDEDDELATWDRSRAAAAQQQQQQQEQLQLQPAAATPVRRSTQQPGAVHMQAVEADHARRLRIAEQDNARLRSQVERLQQELSSAAGGGAAAPAGSPQIMAAVAAIAAQRGLPPAGGELPCDDDVPDMPPQASVPHAAGPGPWMSAALRLAPASGSPCSSPDAACERRRRTQRRKRRRRRHSSGGADEAALLSLLTADQVAAAQPLALPRPALPAPSPLRPESEPSPPPAAPPLRPMQDAGEVRRAVATAFWDHYNRALDVRLSDAVRTGAARQLSVPRPVPAPPQLSVPRQLPPHVPPPPAPPAQPLLPPPADAALPAPIPPLPVSWSPRRGWPLAAELCAAAADPAAFRPVADLTAPNPPHSLRAASPQRLL
eukprot:TRINITY_DN3226_c0_g2_i2.p1 TRINITY_DN3226_c0_g2~~TRINITY_DN3226_c0_g2_i2.p1  ORF type:complete len:512 (+),score=269.50 TRINITY_DN3226_c0_g2_i2:57-1538(+)